MKVLLPDTNVLSELFRDNRAVAKRLSQADRLLLSPVVEGELRGGFRCGTKLEKNLEMLSDFLKEPFVEAIPVSSETADRYSRIWAQLREKGTPIPSNDIWIAAQATEMGVELLSFDQHFEKIEGLVWTLLVHPKSDPGGIAPVRKSCREERRT